MPTTILFLSANPSDTPRIDTDEEARAIQNARDAARFRDELRLEHSPAARLDDFQSGLLKHEPAVVHFGGHGLRGGGAGTRGSIGGARGPTPLEPGALLVRGEDGRARVVPPAMLARLFELLQGTRCVVLNACFSEAQARALAEHVDYVIGTTEAITDEDAIAFARAFYQALGAGKPMNTAFELGKNRVQAGVVHAFARPGASMVLVEPEERVLVPGTSPLPEKAGPAALLNARHEVVDFVGREELLGELRGWCEGEARVGARLIHAAGGMGKTRLVIELCKRMRAAGWRAGFLHEGEGLAELLKSEWPVVAAIDYAESRPELREMLKRVAGRRSKKALRLILLARNADEWWTDLLRSDGAVKDLLSDGEPIGLRAVSADRETVFHAAVRGLAGARHKKAPEGAPSLADPRYERVLYVHMAALAAVEGRAIKADALMEDTLDHEERFWREQLPDRVAVDEMRQVVAALTLTGGVGSTADARAMVELISGAPDKKMALLLRDLYPGTGAQHVGGLEPDLLGEAMVWRVLSREGAGAGPYLDRVFEGAAGQAIRTGFAVLGRLSEDHKAADGWIARVLGRDVAGRAMEALAAARSVGDRTAHAGLGRVLAEALEREGTVEIAERLEAELPHPSQTVSLREVGRWVLETRLAHLPEGADAERARLLSNLSVWQSTLGQREAALASAQGAVALRRRLAEARPDAFLPYLAASLDNLGTWQSELGQREGALASTQEAVTLRRRLAEARPDAFLPDLAKSLNNVGIRQSAMGQREAALASTQQAVALYRRLVEARPDAFLPELAQSLNNLGNRQSALGQREAALASTREAVALRRGLAEARPDAFLPGLAQSLNNLGNRQSELGQREAALVSTQEAVALYRRLAEARPDAFLPDLATSLHNLSLLQNALAQPEPALASAHEALDAYWPFFLAHPAAFATNTADMVDNLLDLHRTLNRPPPPALLQRQATLTAHLAR